MSSRFPSPAVVATSSLGALFLLSAYNYYHDKKYPKGTSVQREQYRQRLGTTEKRSRFRAKQRKIQIICAPSAGEYGSSIDTFIGKNDRVLIIRGTTPGSNSSDGGEARAAAASGSSPCVYQGSVWDIRTLQRHVLECGGEEGVTAVCLDATNIHGNDIFADSIALVRLLRSLFDPSLRTVIVKSRVLAKHSRAYSTFPMFKKAGGLEGLSLSDSCGNVGVRVVSVVGVTDYRSTIPLVVKEGDRVLEIGCHHGKSTRILADAVGTEGKAVGIDIGKLCVDRAREQYGEKCRFEVADAWDTAGLVRLDPNFDAIYVDVGGISGADGEFEALALVRQLMCAYAGGSLKCIVVKSRCLRDHAAVWYHSDDLLRSS